jgi:predicted amidohydrolase YtcJ
MLLFKNGLIRTMDPACPVTDQIYVSTDGKVGAIGSQCPAEAAKVIDLEGKVLIPGFHDPHIHVWKVGDLLGFRLDLRGVQSKADMLDAIADFARQTNHDPTRWVLARGFNEALFPDVAIPTRHDLDRVIPNRLCQIIRTCAHIAVVNTHTLQHCGIHATTPVPPGGEVRLGSDGLPNGILTETALGLIAKHIPPPNTADYRQMILLAQDALLEQGVTTVADPAVHPELLAVYHAMAAAGELKIRLQAIPIRVPDGATTALPLPTYFESDFLRVDTVKFFADGGISGKTAAVHIPYKNTREQGVLRLEPSFFEALARESQNAGFRIATHAIGDQAIDLVLDVYERILPTRPTHLRHRIEHLGLPTPEHLGRMYEMGVLCVTQPMFIGELGRNMRQYLPDTYLNRVYPFRQVIESDVALVFSSDSPVVSNFSPLAGIWHAATRLDNAGHTIAPDEFIDPYSALMAYTHTAAQADGFVTTGQIKPGFWADLVQLSHDPLDVDLLPVNRVERVWVGGNELSPERQ